MWTEIPIKFRFLKNFLHEMNREFEVTHTYTKNYASSVSLEHPITGQHSESKKCSPHIAKLRLKKIFHYYYLLTPHSTVLLQKLTVFQPVNKFPHILWNPKIHYHSHKCPPSGTIMSLIDPVHTPTSHFL